MSIVNHTKVEIKSLADGKSYTLLDTQNDVIGKIVAGIPITRRIDNNLFSMALTVKGRDKTMFSEFDIVTFDISDSKGTTSTKWIVGADHLQQYQPAHLSFTHELTLVESTKILEKVKIFSLNLTNTSNSLLDQAYRALTNAELLVSGQSYSGRIRFSLDGNLQRMLRNKPSEDFFNSNTDLRTVLDNILMSSDCRCYVEDIKLNDLGDIGDIVIGCKSLKEVQDITPNWTKSGHGDIVSEEKSNNCQDYAGKILTRGYNSVSQSQVTFTDTFKSSQSVLTNKSGVFSCPFPIGERGFDKFIIKKTKIYYGSSVDSGVDVDIAKHLIPQESYDLLPSDSQQWYIPYRIGDKTVEVGTYSDKYLNRQQERMSHIVGYAGNFENKSANGDWRSKSFVCTYHAQIDTASEVTKPNTYDKDHILMGLMDTQNENNLDIGRHGKHQLSLIRRTGNPEWYIDVVATNFSSLLPLMAKIDGGYVVYEQEIAVYDKFVKCRYYLSKDFNTISSKAGVNRTKHLFDIPLESDECPLINKQYLVFSKSYPWNGIDKTYSSNMLRNALLTLVGGAEGVNYTLNGTLRTSGTKIKYMLLKSQNKYEQFPRDTENSSGETPYKNGDYAFMRPTLNYGQSKNMYFVATVLDNYSVDYARDGYQFSLWGDGGNRITYCRYVSKNNATIGECDKFILEYAYESKTIDNIDDFDTSVTEAFTQKLPITDSTDYIKSTSSPFTIDYIKDRTQRPVFFSAIECIPAKDDFDNIVIGTAFARDNNLVKDNGNGLGGLSLYISTTKTINDTVDNIIIDNENYTKLGAASDYFYVFSDEKRGEGTLATKTANNTGARSWVIANNAGEVYIGANGELANIWACFQQYPYFGNLTVTFSDNALKFIRPTDKLATPEYNIVPAKGVENGNDNS